MLSIRVVRAVPASVTPLHPSGVPHKAKKKKRKKEKEVTQTANVHLLPGSATFPFSFPKKRRRANVIIMGKCGKRGLEASHSGRMCCASPKGGHHHLRVRGGGGIAVSELLRHTRENKDVMRCQGDLDWVSYRRAFSTL